MFDRGFTEVDLRSMLERPDAFEADHEPGRWRVRASHLGAVWTIIVEPDPIEEEVTVITAFRTY